MGNKYLVAQTFDVSLGKRLALSKRFNPFVYIGMLTHVADVMCGALDGLLVYVPRLAETKDWPPRPHRPGNHPPPRTNSARHFFLF
jgi:hypothetical protein